MIKVKVLKRHAKTTGVGLWAMGDEYMETPLAAEQKANAGFVEFVDGQPAVKSKESPELYQRRVLAPQVAAQREPVTIEHRSGNWYTLSDGSKVLGKEAAARRAGITVEALEELDVDTDSN